MTGPEEKNSGLIEVPEHLKPITSPSAKLKHGLSNTAVGGGRFGQGVVEINPKHVGPQAIRQAAGAGSVETLGPGMYRLPAVQENGNHVLPTSNSEVRRREADTPRFDITGKPEFPDEM